jgi:hypothetical protein
MVLEQARPGCLLEGYDMIKADCFLASKGYVLADFREMSLSPPPTP